MTKESTRNLLIEAATGFSQEESLAFSQPGKDDEPDPGLTRVWKTTASRADKASRLVASTDNRTIAHGRTLEAAVKQYTVRVKAFPNQVDAQCDCVDFIIRARNKGEGIACKHVVAVLQDFFGPLTQYLSLEG